MNFFSYETFRYLFEEVFIRGEYYFFSRNTKPTIFDCGANIGMTVLFFKWLYPRSSIFAFEPNLSSFSVLESNILKNKLSNVKLENVAIGNKNSEIFFYSDPNDPGSVVASTKKTRAQTFRTSVAEIKLSSYIKRNKIAIIHFLKMDIEGSEFESIIELSNNKTLGLIHEMIVEYHHNIRKNNSSLAKLLIKFEKLNFRYQMYSKPIPLYKKNVFQDILLYIYR